jgi:hypothetical protein
MSNIINETVPLLYMKQRGKNYFSFRLFYHTCKDIGADIHMRLLFLEL